MGYKVTVQPAEEPITLAEAKAHLRVEFSTEDSLITSLIVAARQIVEQYTGIGLISQTITEYYDTFPIYYPKFIRLSVGNVVSVTTLKYYDTGGTLQTWSTDNYVLDATIYPARIGRKENITYPQVLNELNAVEVTYIVGWSSASEVPELIKSAMYLILADLYENREDRKRALPQASQMILQPYKAYTYYNY